MHTNRFKSLSTPITADNQNMSHETSAALKPAPLIPNSRWTRAKEDMHTNPFRQSGEARFSHNDPPRTNSRWQNDDSEDKRRGGDMFKRRDRREPNSRYQSRREFNSFNRRTKQAPKPVFKMENTDFPPLGKAESPVSSIPNMNFSKAAHKNKDRPGPKHIIQFPERMPRTKKENLDERDPLDWNTDDENEAYEATACNDEHDVEPEWPAKGGYID